VGVDELADGNWLGGKADNLVKLTDGLTRGDGLDGELVAGGNVGGRDEVQAVEGLASSDRLEGDHDVVRGSEFESVGAQPVLSLCVSVALGETFTIVVRPHSTPTDRQKDSPVPYYGDLVQSLLSKGDRSGPSL
jgi:hypothetical protein